MMITEHASIPTAVEATQLGAFNYVEKMLDREKVLLTIRNAIETGRLKRQNEAFLSQLRSRYELVGDSLSMIHVREQIERAAPTDSVVLITGESGTGKELVARQIHYCSRRRDRDFVSIDAGTLADSLADSELFGHCKGAFTGALQDRVGLVAQAEGGTLFLDEISNASLPLQAKLLHLVQEREYRRVGENEVRHCNVRIVAASNQDLAQLSSEGKFRQDLLYRLRVVSIHIPPLRERKEDIPMLTNRFVAAKSLQYYARTRTLAPDAVTALIDHDWPGNVRELENSVERIVVLSEHDEIGADEVKSILGDLWLARDGSLRSLSEMTRDFKRECIVKAIAQAEGRIARAAEILHIDRTHLYKLLHEFDLNDQNH